MTNTIVGSERVYTDEYGNPMERHEGDHYVSDPRSIDDLLYMLKKHNVRFPRDSIWDNACGSGVLVYRMQEYGYEVFGSDKYDWTGCFPQNDFLKNPDFYEQMFGEPACAILGNPPYKKDVMKSFITMALDVTGRYVWYLCKNTALESKERYNLFSRGKNLRYIFYYTSRLTVVRWDMILKGIPQNKGKAFYNWLVWDLDYEGMPQVDWIPPFNRKGDWFHENGEKWRNHKYNLMLNQLRKSNTLSKNSVLNEP